MPYAIFESLRLIVFGLNNMSLFDWLLDITSIKPAYWYLQIILISYVSFFICSLSNGLYKNRYYILGLTGLLLFIFGGEIRAEQAFSFFTGVFISDKKSDLKNIILNKKIAILSFIIGVLFLALKQVPTVRNFYDSYIWYALQLLMKISFTMGFISVTGILTKVFSNNFLYFMGNISYEFYLVHFALLNMLYLHVNKFVICICFLFLSIAGAWIFKFLWSKIIDVYAKQI